MQLLDATKNHRILIVDDNEAIHDDFNKILTPPKSESAAQVNALADSIFGAPDAVAKPREVTFQLTHALQGREGFDKVVEAIANQKPYAMAFVDVRMPPGWNGIETVEKIWEKDHEIEIVLCTAYSDFSWDEIADRLVQPERLLILRKPFDPLEVRQLAYGLTSKWFLRRQAACRMQDLEIMVEERVREIEELRSKLEQISAQQRGSV